jgi:hypothetical protein
MLRPVTAALALTTLMMALPGAARATCGEECDGQYSSTIDDCRSQYRDDPADADDLVNCIQEARDDYRSCLDDCASAAMSLPHWRGLVARGKGGSTGPVAASLSHDHRQPSAGCVSPY